MKKLTYHPACLLFPKLPKDELKALAADINANGLPNSVVRYHGQVLDGRKVIGFDREKKYLANAKRQIKKG